MTRCDTFVLCLLLPALLSALLPDGSAAATTPVDRRQHLDAIRTQLDAGDWKLAQKLISRAEKEILERSRPQADDERDLAELALYLAVTEANRGDRDAAEWYWYLAYGLHAPTAYRDVSAWGEAADVFSAIEVRSVGRDPKGVKSFRNYEGIVFEPAEVPATRIPAGLDSSHALERVQSVQVEVFLDEHGRPHSPRVLGHVRVPILLYSLLAQLFETSWKPARFEGEPVPMLVQTTLTPPQPRRW